MSKNTITDVEVVDRLRRVKEAGGWWERAEELCWETAKPILGPNTERPATKVGRDSGTIDEQRLVHARGI